MDAIVFMTFSKNILWRGGALIESISGGNRLDGIKLKAIAGLGKYKTDAALAGLAHCRKDKNTNVRQSCAQALSSSPHPKAWPALLSMKADPYVGVRLTVLHALAKRPCAQTATLIRKMTRDPAKLVKNEAKRYLKRCGRP